MGKRILIGAPIQQKPEILQQFLLSLTELEAHSYTADYYFADDNRDPASTQLLRQFCEKHPQTTIQPSGYKHTFATSEQSHFKGWKEDIIWKVATMKDTIISHALTNEYDYLFLVDSDLVLHPATIEQLLSTEKDIVANIFWTKWDPQQIEMPQVWQRDFYTQYKVERDLQLTKAQQEQLTLHFFQQLRQPGLYEVGGLGACTLISRHALARGVRFEQISNISLRGEDRHFCVRAVAMGFSLYVDTHYPAYHIYRPSQLAGVAPYKERCAAERKKAPSR
ncbi:glycosyltransferase family 2 protein [Mechercharimyces sp. CAU 1602]|uniref:glycosyltransferase family 2 protein n=1 Tax=Mechercharimyces sp. CAU 1602 TaxID=2973933 RepID=UPI002161EAB1|nr:glycosyltransferase family 2 protein [Mechercharimyces sp. CAU 1602]MCS1350002.1 glycosyltransferase family 2 protein [Mechercharimyces sp. CAU 1602]